MRHPDDHLTNLDEALCTLERYHGLTHLVNLTGGSNLPCTIPLGGVHPGAGQVQDLLHATALLIRIAPDLDGIVAVEIVEEEGIPSVMLSLSKPRTHKTEVTKRRVDTATLLTFLAHHAFGGYIRIEPKGPDNNRDYLRLNLGRGRAIPSHSRPMALRLIVGTYPGGVTLEHDGEGEAFRDLRRQGLGRCLGEQKARRYGGAQSGAKHGREEAIKASMALYDTYCETGIPLISREKYEELLRRCYAVLDMIPLGRGPCRGELPEAAE